ncbi:MAG: hypothetical protein M1455_03830 [Actinobacteria bacterium]|nr:hypothetical protein [Actinomycetota bacterium]
MTVEEITVELERELAKLGLIPTWDDRHPLWVLIPRECVNVRQRLNTVVPARKNKNRPATFWDISEKYRFDLLGQEIAWISDQLAFAIGLASLHRPNVRQTADPPYVRPTMSDSLFWFYIDAGLRNASSCWDRVAIFLDLAFSLGLQTSCNFSKVIEMLKKTDAAKDTEELKKLAKFRDGKFQELEAGKGVGARHEATHIITPRLRYFAAEIIEPQSKKILLSTGRGHDYWIDFLLEHHGLYLKGAQDAVDLAANHS